MGGRPSNGSPPFAPLGPNGKRQLACANLRSCVERCLRKTGPHGEGNKQTYSDFIERGQHDPHSSIQGRALTEQNIVAAPHQENN